MKPKLRILHTEASKGWGGQEIRVIEESYGLMQRGYDVRIAAPLDARIVEAARRRGIPVHPLPLDRRRFGSLRAVLRLFREIGPDVVVTHSSADSWLVAVAARVSSMRPAVVRMRHLTMPVASGPLNRWLYGAAISRLVTTGEAIRRMLIERLRLDPNSVVSIPTGTDLSRFQPGDRTRARKGLGLPVDEPIVGTVAVLRSWKGHRFLISAMSDPRLRTVRLVLVGGGPMESTLRAQVANEGLGDRVIFAGHQEDVVPWLQAMDVFVLPSTANETTPQAIQQAMAVGIPVVTTPVGAGLELVRDGETGLVVPSENPKAIAEAIRKLLDEPETTDRLVRTAAAHVRAEFSSIAMLDAMENVFRQVTEQHRSLKQTAAPPRT